MATLVVLAFSFSLFGLGCLGMFLPQRDMLLVLFSLELLLLASTFNFVVCSFLLDDIFGQVYGLIILALAASETAIGLAILIGFYQSRGGISVDLINLLRP